jgi:hypothetical protein
MQGKGYPPTPTKQFQFIVLKILKVSLLEEMFCLLKERKSVSRGTKITHVPHSAKIKDASPKHARKSPISDTLVLVLILSILKQDPHTNKLLDAGAHPRRDSAPALLIHLPPLAAPCSLVSFLSLD